LLIPVRASIKVVEVESGVVVRVLSPVGRSEVTQIIINPLKSVSQIISCSVDGTLAIWDWTTGEQVKGFRTRHAIHSMIVKSFDFASSSLELLIVSLRLKGPLGCNLPDSRKLFNYYGQKMTSLIEHIKIDLSSGAFKMRQIFKSRGLTRLALSPCGKELVFNSREEIRFCRLDEGEDFKVYRTLKHSSAITRIQYHPKEPCLVLADRHGQIVMWYCLEDKVMAYTYTYPQRTLHWHANEVTDMAFTSAGQYLLSGGEEAVMVLWQVESGLRQYLPRLGDPIHFITVSGDDRWVAISTRDNAVHLVSLTSGSTLSVSKSIRGCMLIPGNASNSICKASARSSCLILPGNPGTLQVYDPVKDSVEGVLEVAPQNRPTGFAPQGKKVLEIVRSSVSACGKWMVTLEQRNSRKALKTILTARLKFWGKQPENENSATWTLLSIVDRPHSDLITDLCIWKDQRGIPFAASTSRDGTFKLWEINLEHGIWTCFHVGSYHDIPATSVSANVEGTKIAVVYGAAVTIWRLEDICLIDVLMTTQVAKLSEARFLADGSIVTWCPENGAFIFNNLSDGKLVLSWHAPVSPKVSIAVHPTEPQFAMIVDTPSCEHMGVLTYASESPVPIGFYMLPERFVDFRAVVYVPSPECVRQVRPGQAESHILVLFDALSGEFTLLGTENASRLNRSDFKFRIKPTQVGKPGELAEASRQRSKSLYRAIFESSDGLTQNATLDAKAQVIKHNMAELFAAVPQISSEDVLLPLVASHVLPPVSMLFSNYIQKILKKRN
jgi:NET1-associated nuclear protein 1 (U3 small nucleolar RNA-associated protein 17)